jgi:hypothetical protein
MNWYRIERKRVVAQYVYVKAESPAEATASVEDMEWAGETGDEAVRYFKDGKPKKLDGIPRWLWEDLGYPDDEVIAA